MTRPDLDRCELKCVVVCSAHLLLSEPPLDLLVVTNTVGDGSGQLSLDARKPGAEVTHVLIKLLHRHQGLLQLLHPKTSDQWSTVI